MNSISLNESRKPMHKNKSGILLLVSLSIMFLVAGCCGDCAFPPPPAALVAPTVSATAPACSATGVDLATRVNATFSKAMDPTTINGTTFTLSAGATPVAGAVTYAAATNIATFTPTLPLAANTVFTITVTTGARDIAGIPVASNFTCTFTTGPPFLPGPPAITSTTPANGLAPCVSTGRVTATFNKPMDPATINSTTFTVTGPGVTPVAGAVSYDVGTRTATFTPTNAFAVSTTFTATVTTGARDLAGVALVAGAVPNPWQFVTCATGVPPAGVNLRSAGTFVVLAGTTVTNTGPSSVGGDLGVSPGTAVVGFPPGIVINGAIFAGGSVAAQAQADLTTAYNDLAGRTAPAPATVSGNLGGQTLAPGIYKSTSTLAISSGDLTLDARGDPNAIFIFQIASSLTTTVGTKVVLIGGAKAANVYWQVGSSATLGTNSIFKGNILALTSITITTGAVLDGRALAINGAVTLDNNIITKPAP